MTSKLFFIYFYFSFCKNPHKPTLNNKLNKTKLKLKKVNPKFKPLDPFFFFFPRLFFFFPTVTVHHLHSPIFTAGEHFHFLSSLSISGLLLLLLQWLPNKHILCQQWLLKQQSIHPLPCLRPFNINLPQWNWKSIPQLLQVNRKPMSRGLSKRSWKR